MNNIYTSDQVKVMFEDLFREIKHGDAEHQRWLRDKMQDFVTRNVIGGLHTLQFDPIPDEMS